MAGRPVCGCSPGELSAPPPSYLGYQGIANLRADIKAEIANEFKGLYRFLLVTAVSIIAVIVGILKLFP